MLEKISTRAAYGEALLEYGIPNERVYALEADVAGCTMSGVFGEACPERFFEIGIAEANMIAMGAGFAANGKIPVCHAFGLFTAGRAYDQIRNSVAYPKLNVKIVGTNVGLTVGEDGPTHQCIEDLALMRVVPNMVVLSPCDGYETKQAVKAMLEYEGPVFMRTGRPAVETVTNRIQDYHFQIGKGITLAEGNDVTIIATGLMVQEALKASDLLKEKEIYARVINIHTIKPIDREIIIRAARETKAIVTAEEHNIIGGLGSAVAEVICEECLVPLEYVGVQDKFGHSGEAWEVMQAYGLTAEHIAEKAIRAVSRKEKALR
ncbi:MAG: transketolase family protein [Lachnospiraceae bacterium]